MSFQDFHSIFAQSDPLGDDYITNLELVHEVGTKDKPERPQTLTAPARLPKCCNFRNRDWRFYVSGNFNTDIRDDAPTEYIDPLDSLINEQTAAGCPLGADGRVLRADAKYSSSDVNDSSRRKMDKQIKQDAGKQGNAVASCRKASLTTGASKASGNYQNHSEDNNGAGDRKPGAQSGEKATVVSVEHQPDRKDDERNSDGVHYIGKTVTTQAVDNADACINHKMDPNSSRHSSAAVIRATAQVNSVCAHKVDAGKQNGDVMPHSAATDVRINGYANEEPKREHRTTSVGIKTNGCLVMSTKRTMRDRRLRTRSDPSKMATSQLCLGHDHWPCKPGHQVAAVQTDGPPDGILSPTIDRRRIPTTPLMDAMDLSGHSQTRTAKLGDTVTDFGAYPVGGRGANATNGLADSCRKRSQSADRIEQRQQRHGRRREKSQSPSRRRQSPSKSDCSKTVSKVSRSTQTHRSIIRYGSSASSALVKNAASKNTSNKSATIHIKLDEVLAAQTHGSNGVSQNKADELKCDFNKTNIFQENQKGKHKAKMSVVSASPTSYSSPSSLTPSAVCHQSNPCYVCEECERGRTNVQGEVAQKKCSCPSVKIKPVLPSKDISTSSSSSLTATTKSSCNVSSSASGKIPPATSKSESAPNKAASASGSSAAVIPAATRSKLRDTETCALCAEGTSHSGKTLVFVPSRESRRIYVRPQMPVIVEDVPKTEEDTGDEWNGGTPAIGNDDVKYYGSLKIHRSPQAGHPISTSLSKSANEVYKQQRLENNGMPSASGAKTLLDSMHRKYCANQYKQHEKAKSDEMLVAKSYADFNGDTRHGITQHSKSTNYLSDNKLRLAVTPDTEGHKSPGYGSLTSSPPGSSSGSATSPKSPGSKLDGVSRSSSGIGSLSSNQSQKSSPSPEEHQGDPEYDEETILIDCCDAVTPECDIKVTNSFLPFRNHSHSSVGFSRMKFLIIMQRSSLIFGDLLAFVLFIIMQWFIPAKFLSWV